MIQKLSIAPRQIQYATAYTIEIPEALAGFPAVLVDADSYIVGATVYSGLDVDLAGRRHCIAIGKGCSLAEDLTFLVDMNHDYGAVSQGELSFLQGVKSGQTIPRKGTILIQNDVWIGHGATILSGVTLHNGCVVAADAVVTKDVPPYAIVGGNPARVIRYRFDAETISALQRIAWWDWPQELLQKRREAFLLPPQEFAKKYLPEAEERLRGITPFQLSSERQVVLFIPDMNEPYPLYTKVLAQFFEKDRPNVELLLYLSAGASTSDHLLALDNILRQYALRDSYVTVQTGEALDEHMLFQAADYFITTRCRETVRRTCLADLYDVKILYGTDDPIFPEALE